MTTIQISDRLAAIRLRSAYMRGWTNGANGLTAPAPTDFTDTGTRNAYTSGYVDGARSRDSAIKGTEKRYAGGGR